MSTTRTASLTIDGKTVEFPVMTGVHGNDVIDIRTLGAKTGMFTYDPGFLSTASCSSKITYIDGDEGESAVSRLSDRATGAELQLP
jgi:citrate synthase